MLLTQIICAALMAWGAYLTIRCDRWPTRTQVLTRLLTPITIGLFIRLIVDFGGWDGWFIYVWLAAVAAFAYGIFRVANVWPDLPWRSGAHNEEGTASLAAVNVGAGAAASPATNAAPGASEKLRARETRGLVVGVLAVLVVMTALVAPGMMLT